jgi:hypothetical protein
VTNGRDAADRIRQEGWDFDMRSRDAAQRAASMLAASDRLEPLVVDTRRGEDQLMRILETLARVELTDGLTMAQLIVETTARLPRDTTVIPILTWVSEETAVALGNLRRRGFAVTAIVNIFEDHDYAEAASKLLAERIETRHLKDERSVSEICKMHALR